MPAKQLWLSNIVQVLFFACLAVQGGCASSPRYANTPLSEKDKQVFRASPEICDVPAAANCKRNPSFVGLAISGGGSRAANYAAAVMSELDRIGVLQHVNAISSVSGGSVTAAYYAVRGKSPLSLNERKLFWEKAKNDLSKDFRSTFVTRFLRPDNFIQSMFGPVGRTELMAGVFDEYLFNGMSFGDLDQNPLQLIINATAINDLYGVTDKTRCTNRKMYASSIRWESVSFTEDFFSECLRSSISTYPISYAVAASAAFPGLFSSVPLARFGPDEKFEKIIPYEYLHVIDGGPSDNLGIDGILRNWAAKSPVEETRNTSPCLIIVIDAFASGDVDLRNLRSDSRSAVDRFVDLNFFDSIDAMLNRRRLETLRNLGLPSPPPTINQISVQDFPVYGNTFHFWDRNRVVERVNPFAALRADVSVAESLGLARNYGPECTIWYIGIDSLKDLVAPDWEFRFDPSAPYRLEREYDDYEATIKEHFAAPEARNRVTLWDVTSRIRTDFDLVGPKNCSSKVLSDALWAAGAYSVRADLESRRSVCSWLKKAGMKTADTCTEPNDEKTTALPIKYVKHENSGYSIECDTGSPSW